MHREYQTLDEWFRTRDEVFARVHEFVQAGRYSKMADELQRLIDARDLVNPQEMLLVPTLSRPFLFFLKLRCERNVG